MSTEIPSKVIVLPENVTVNLDGKKVEISGEKGRIIEDFSHAPVSIRVEDRKIIISTSEYRKKKIAMIGTVKSHISNMIKGVTKGFRYRLKIVYSHFPITVKVDRDKILIENFLGERNPRIAKIVGDAKVMVKGDDIIVEGINLKHVSQTAANIEQATKIKARDPRKFLDGIYIYEKSEGIYD
ncbi:MAG: 50S ribosomal protein L6 [Nitrososphaerota archaeon]|nr:50S ribosomal protein L6 [Candidatus Bathyarchaeota archaeon]MDW8048283.1 50S ribosomal protein L6 [Nitrososphaerota archaeon]